MSTTDTSIHEGRIRMDATHVSVTSSSTEPPARRLVGQHAVPPGPVDLQSM